MVCIRSRIGCITRQTFALCAAQMPSGTPIAIDNAVEPTTRTRVWMVSFHRPWLMMNSSPSNTPRASFQERCSQ